PPPGSAANPPGALWRVVMRLRATRPTVCHTLPAPPARRVARYPYRCACDQTRYLSIIRHRRSQRGDTVYRCTQCAVELVYTGGAARR
ncbi:MAG: hypothetical protein L0H83_07620, partial [Salinisphaera sp.]|nr:hypothetical protein [Salinisphaera sp.]